MKRINVFKLISVQQNYYRMSIRISHGKVYQSTYVPVGILSETPCLRKAIPSLLMAQTLMQPPHPDSRPIDIL